MRSLDHSCLFIGLSMLTIERGVELSCMKETCLNTVSVGSVLFGDVNDTPHGCSVNNIVL